MKRLTKILFLASYVALWYEAYVTRMDLIDLLDREAHWNE